MTRYFAASNSKNGFKSYFQEIFSPDVLDRIFILKGGPGTGKSRLLSDIGMRAEELGYEVEYFLCSSDTNSLDGIVVQELSLGILDGTAPHMTDPVYPGAVEIILNLGDFFSVERLQQNKEPIKQLNHRKSELYKRVYRFLNACAILSGQTEEILLPAVLTEKMTACAYRMMREEEDGDGYTDKTRLLSAVGTNGNVTLNTFEEKAERNVAVLDKYGLAPLFLHEVKQLAKLKQLPVITSYSPLEPEKIDALLLPQLKLSFTVKEADDGTLRDRYFKVVNMDRFVDKGVVSENKNKLRFLKKAGEALFEEAENDLAQIRELHAKLEQIYISAMDFTKKEQFSERISKEIFK